MPDGSQAQVTHIGTSNLLGFLTLEHVMCVPYFTFNLISVSQLTATKKYALIFLHDCYYIQD